MDISTAAVRAPMYEPFSAGPAVSLAYRREPADDFISVSSDGRLISEALKSAHSSPDMRQDKIAAIREKIANGTYEIDSRRIARCLIREEPGLFKI